MTSTAERDELDEIRILLTRINDAWEMAYELDGQDARESGHDVFVLARDERGWRAILPDGER